MRVVFIILLLLLFAISSQINFLKQLDALVKDSANNFKKSLEVISRKTRFTEATPDSVFYTSVALDETSNNELLIISSE